MNTITVNQKELKQAINHIKKFSALKDATRPPLQNIQFNLNNDGILTLGAADGFIMALVDIDTHQRGQTANTYLFYDTAYKLSKTLKSTKNDTVTLALLPGGIQVLELSHMLNKDAAAFYPAYDPDSSRIGPMDLINEYWDNIAPKENKIEAMVKGNELFTCANIAYKFGKRGDVFGLVMTFTDYRIDTLLESELLGTTRYHLDSRIESGSKFPHTLAINTLFLKDIAQFHKKDNNITILNDDPAAPMTIKAPNARYIVMPMHKERVTDQNHVNDYYQEPIDNSDQEPTQILDTQYWVKYWNDNPPHRPYHCEGPHFDPAQHVSTFIDDESNSLAPPEPVSTPPPAPTVNAPPCDDSMPESVRALGRPPITYNPPAIKYYCPVCNNKFNRLDAVRVAELPPLCSILCALNKIAAMAQDANPETPAKITALMSKEQEILLKELPTVEIDKIFYDISQGYTLEDIEINSPPQPIGEN
jgi:hypothetical protein